MTVASLLGILMWMVGVPALTGILFARPHLARPLLGVMVFTICHVKKPFYQEVFYTMYRGVDRGFGVTVPDVIFLALFSFAILGGTRRKRVWWPYNSTQWFLLISISLISIVGSPAGYYGLFSLQKLFRGYILYWVMVHYVHDRESVQTVVRGLLGSVLFQGWLVVYHKYVTKSVVNRSVGSFPHPNSLAMYLDLILPMLLAILLANLFSRGEKRAATLAIPLGMLCVVFTKSRASLVIMLGSLGATLGISILMRPTLYKIRLALMGAIAASIGAAVLLPRIIARFENAPKESAETRAYFNDAARAMANDLTFGVGLNAYSWSLANTNYYWYVYSDKLDELEDPDEFKDSVQGQSRLGTAHHIFYLHAAETGWAGMYIYMAFIGLYYVKNVWLFLWSRDPYFKAILLGLLVGFTTLHLQGLLEWAFRQTQIFFLFCSLSGFVVALGRVERSLRSRKVLAT